ncbi:uncharacterized protein GLRG_01707 [Colletotrichum graminicola M1.001]|uniref:MFS general substrate transporter n=1 Tax=Colletotrichum graminicola (strain M1.001 / M2 / FGSC 10212) TaxID=645133 RepID=E3Q933_COLGM|nr:uncharacterized protein GLRG_01707 [Colletotrichum graminicola M1.001]EFQ27212.1 hypothetical protein GLRG_01707 [Colletotrichum graminicola M1.001]
MILAQRFLNERVISVIVALWGLCQILTTTYTNYRGLYAQGFCLGLLESGISPMLMLIVGSWYKKDEQASSMGIWYNCTGYVAIFSPLINCGFGKLGSIMPSWRHIFYIISAITIIQGLLLFIIPPPNPIRPKGFSEREQHISVARLRSNNSGVHNTHSKMERVSELGLDPRFWLAYAFTFLCIIANGPISTFVPIIINDFGFSTLNSLLLTMPVAGVLGLVYRFVCTWQNNKRDKAGIVEGYDHAYKDDLTDLKLQRVSNFERDVSSSNDLAFAFELFSASRACLLVLYEIASTEAISLE